MGTDEDQFVRLLKAVGQAGAVDGPLTAQREFVLGELVKILQADAAWWSWGQGIPDKSEVTPLAFIHVGYSPQQLALHVEAALQAETDSLLRSKVMPFLEHADQNTHCFDQLISDKQWYGSGLYKKFYARSGLDRQLNSVRYFDRDFFANANFCRKAGKPPFSESQRQLLDWAMAGITLMHISAAEAIPPEKLKKLTPRQRTVLLMVLDGQSRKQIAHQLHISTHTVNEHVKQLYLRFNVNSIGALAAGFLQSRK